GRRADARAIGELELALQAPRGVGARLLLERVGEQRLFVRPPPVDRERADQRRDRVRPVAALEPEAAGERELVLPEARLRARAGPHPGRLVVDHPRPRRVLLAVEADVLAPLRRLLADLPVEGGEPGRPVLDEALELQRPPLLAVAEALLEVL